MYVCVYDGKNQRHYRSMVYGLMNTGYYERAIVMNPLEENFVLVSYLEKDGGKLTPMYQHINCCRADWIACERDLLLRLRKYCQDREEDFPVVSLTGYPEVLSDEPFLLRLLKDGYVPVSEASIAVRENEDADQWNYIRTQKDADELMAEFMGFHDSTLDQLIYEEEYGKTQLTVRFDNSGWFGIIELCFEGLIALNLRPPLENESRELFSASFFVEEDHVFWADDEIQKEDINHPGTFVKALSGKWRRVETGRAKNQ